MQAWLAKLPKEFQDQVRYNGVGAPATGGTDNASFDCYGAPVFGLELARLGLRLVHAPHQSRQLRQDRVRRSQGERDDRRDARVSRVRRSDDISRERADLTRGGGGGGGGGRGRGGPPSGRGAINLGGGGGGRAPAADVAPTTDDKGWGSTCPKAPRFFNDTSRVTAPSNRP